MAKRSQLWGCVCVALILAAVIIVLAFFLYPRTPTVAQDTNKKISLNTFTLTPGNMLVDFNFTLNYTNANYVSVTASVSLGISHTYNNSKTAFGTITVNNLDIPSQGSTAKVINVKFSSNNNATVNNVMADFAANNVVHFALSGSSTMTWLSQTTKNNLDLTFALFPTFYNPTA